MVSMESALFSLSAESIASLRLVRIKLMATPHIGTRLVRFVPRTLDISAEPHSSGTKMGLGTLEDATSTPCSSGGALCCV